MKNILAATDFSDCANGAAVFAAELARQTGARLVLFHAYHPAVLLEEASIWADPVLLEKEVQEKIDNLAHELHKNYGISVTRLLKPGFPLDEILAVGQKIKADLLVLGARGAGVRTTERTGKIATELLKKAELPVICLPSETVSAGIENLLTLPVTDWQTGNPSGLNLLKNVLQPA